MLSDGLKDIDLSKIKTSELVPKQEEESEEVVQPQEPVPEVPSGTTAQNTIEPELIQINEQFLNSEIPGLDSDLLRSDININ